MRGNSDMFLTVLAVASLFGVTSSSGGHSFASIGHAPVVTATSSQYFERTFNRLVAPPQIVPIAPEPPVFVEPALALPVPVPPPQAFPIHPIPSVPVQPVQPIQPNQPVEPIQPNQTLQPVEPNVATAVAIANAAAPVATILLPPYPFGVPHTFGLIPQPQPNNDRETTREPTTTTQSTTQVEVTTQKPETISPLPRGPALAGSNSDNSFSQVLPSNENVNFKQYLAPRPPQQQQNQDIVKPQPLPHQHHHHHHHHHHPSGHILLHSAHPQKLRTSVEVVKVPLAYIAPPPLPHFHRNHDAIKVVKHVHTFVPARTKLIIRPVSSKSHNVPAKLYGPPPAKKISFRQTLPLKNEAQVTNFKTFYKPNLKPPSV